MPQPFTCCYCLRNGFAGPCRCEFSACRQCLSCLKCCPCPEQQARKGGPDLELDGPFYGLNPLGSPSSTDAP